MSPDTMLPPSFSGDSWLYFWALASVTLQAAISWMISGWMVRDIWRDRLFTHPAATLSVFRWIMLSLSLSGVLRHTPEAVYMFMWGETSATTMASIIAFKRISDVASAAPGAGWAVLLSTCYPSIAFSLDRNQRVKVDIAGNFHRLARPAIAGVIVLLIAALVAIGKARIAIY